MIRRLAITLLRRRLCRLQRAFDEAVEEAAYYHRYDLTGDRDYWHYRARLSQGRWVRAHRWVALLEA